MQVISWRTGGPPVTCCSLRKDPFIQECGQEGSRAQISVEAVCAACSTKLIMLLRQQAAARRRRSAAEQSGCEARGIRFSPQHLIENFTRASAQSVGSRREFSQGC